MIDFEVSDANIAIGMWAWRLGGQKALLGGFVAGSLIIHNSQPLLELSRGRETCLTRQTSVTTIVHMRMAIC